MLNFQALQLLQQYLVRFATTDNFEDIIESIYGTKIGIAALHQQWLSGDFSLIPEIKVVANGELGTANGAYAASLDEILVSSEFLAQHQDDPAAIAGLLLEEFGHKLDRVLNGNIDTPGDEGAIFRSLVTGQSLSPEMLAGLRAQDDRSVIVLDGNAVAIEKQDFFGDAGGIVTDDSIVGTPGSDNISPGLGNDTVNGNEGNDTLIVDYSANDYTGGNPKGIFTSFSAGSGGIFAYKGNSNDFDSVDFSNIENLNITGTKYDDNIIGSTGNDILKGGLGNDTFTGNGGNDTINGGNGDDTIFGGAGVDLLFGGAGADVFGFNNATEGIDKINDFVVGEDRLSISRAGFGGDAVFGSDSFAGGVLDISRFTLGTSATTSSQRFIYNNKSGALFFDADGVGGANQIRLAQLVGNPALTNTNFSIG